VKKPSGKGEEDRKPWSGKGGGAKKKASSWRWGKTLPRNETRNPREINIDKEKNLKDTTGPDRIAVRLHDIVKTQLVKRGENIWDTAFLQAVFRAGTVEPSKMVHS